MMRKDSRHERLVIRPATEDDMPSIMEIELEAISPPWSHGGLLGEIFNDDSFFMAACLGQGDETAIGFIILRRAADEGELFQIAVSSAFRCLGIADRLMIAAVEWARKNGIATIFLEVRKSNFAAIKLYKKHGFKRKGLRKGYYSSPIEDALVFAKSI